MTDTTDLDVLIVGTGYSGTYLLHHLRRLSYNVLAIDSATQLGGVWCHNTYPGSRVDIEVPTYELDIPELYDHPDGGWIWSERFPAREELQAYFRFVEKRLDLRRSCVFETWVESAVWDDDEAKWTVTATDGRMWKAQIFLPCVGYASKPYVPDFKGLETFQGVKTHTALWPKDGIELEGKRVGVIGTGCSGVQVIQTIAEKVKHLTVFQQTPATAIPMRQRPLSPSESTKASPAAKHDFFAERQTQWDGAKGSMIPRTAKSDPHETREQEFQRLWNEGGFAFWTSNYMDIFGDRESNDLVYDFWRRQVWERINDARAREVLAPERPPYAFGTKRVPLEQNYYDVFNRANVSLVDVRADPIVEIRPDGILTQSPSSSSSSSSISPTVHAFDVLILATGFDFSTGSLTQIDIRRRRSPSSTTGTTTTSSSSSTTTPTPPSPAATTLPSHWHPLTQTYLGLCVSCMPNLFFAYGPQSPSNTCNGAVCAQVQGEFLVGLIGAHFKPSSPSSSSPPPPPSSSPTTPTPTVTVISADATAERTWSTQARTQLHGSLFETTRSYYFADNLMAPSSSSSASVDVEAEINEEEEEKKEKEKKAGADANGEEEQQRQSGEIGGRKKKREPLFYFGGVPAYKSKLDECREQGWKGFRVTGGKGEGGGGGGVADV